METTEPSLNSAKLQDIPLNSLGEQFTNVLAKSSRLCDVEWGTRRDDNALVFHFFPPGYALNPKEEWPSWTQFRDKLEQSALKYFQIAAIDAGYAQELKSFFLILNPRPVVPDLQALIETFHLDLES